LVKGAGELWRRGTTAAFLEAVGDGTLPREAFDRWLVQDALFVQDFTRFAAVVAAKASRDAQKVLIGGLIALDDELDWFERHTHDRGLDLSEEPHPVCRRYADHILAACYEAETPVLLAMFFGIEAAYCAGWGRLTAEGPYEEFIERWTNPQFVAYVGQLGELADSCADPGQQAAFNDIMRHEEAFWRMTWEG
jgi:thiaminase/transcriptional activator TenA